MARLFILDLAPVVQGVSAGEALRQAGDLARTGERPSRRRAPLGVEARVGTTIETQHLNVRQSIWCSPSLARAKCQSSFLADRRTAPAKARLTSSQKLYVPRNGPARRSSSMPILWMREV